MQYLVTTYDYEQVDWSTKHDVLKDEAEHLWELCKDGIIRHIWFSGNRDALFIIESENMNDARRIAEDLPLVKHKLIHYQITTLLPYTGFERLMNGKNR